MSYDDRPYDERPYDDRGYDDAGYDDRDPRDQPFDAEADLEPAEAPPRRTLIRGRQQVDAEELLRRVSDLIAAARPMPLSASAMINKEEVLELLDEAIGRLPDELREARWLRKEREEYLAKMRADGDEITDAARARAEQMVQRTEVVKAAAGRARRIIDSAERAAAARTEGPAGIIGRAVEIGRPALTHPADRLARKLHPAQRQAARMPLAEIAGTSVRIARLAFCSKTDMAAQAPTLVCFAHRHPRSHWFTRRGWHGQSVAASLKRLCYGASGGGFPQATAPFPLQKASASRRRRLTTAGVSHAAFRQKNGPDAQGFLRARFFQTCGGFLSRQVRRHPCAVHRKS